MIVVDTNVLFHSVAPGPRSMPALRVLLRDPEWAAPPLWRSEFRNVLARAMREGGMERDHALAFLDRAAAAIGPRERHPSSPRVLDLARESGCSAYDCEFVYLARAMALPLVTSDARVLHAFPDVAVSLTGFAP